jgi:RimJ/RimL family protein N-acetyltransferase
MLNTINQEKLFGNGIYLGPLFNEDKAILFEWINDTSLVSQSNNYKPVHEQNHQNWFASVIEKDNVRLFAIRTISEDKLIGTCQVYNIDFINSNAEVQIRIGEKGYRGKGYGAEGYKLLSQYAFQHLNLHRIYANVYDDNIASRKAIEKAWFKQEGILRQSAFINGKYKDMYVYALLREEVKSDE